MDPVIIMVGRNDKEGVQDIEIMPDIPSDELADAIAEALGWAGTYDIQVNGRLLGRHQTLAEADAWDGSELTLIGSSRPARIKTPPNSTTGYRVLKVSSQTQNSLSQNLQENGKVLSETNWDPVVPASPTVTLLSSPVKNSRTAPGLPETSEDSDL